MAYFGLQPLSASYLTDYFSGNNTTVAFTLSRAPVSASAVIITISGVKQAASTYGVSGTTLTFSGAPPNGTNNIEVLHLGVQPDTVVQPSYRTITEFTATAGQTTFSPASYTVGYIDVFRNGVKLGTADYTATNGTTVVLNNACSIDDLVRFEGFLITSFNDAIPNTAGAVSDSLIASLSASKLTGIVGDSLLDAVSASKLTGSRTLPNSVVPAGSVIQVFQTYSDIVFNTSSSTDVATGILVNITPTSSTSKILIMMTGVCGSAFATNFGRGRITRSIGGATYSGVGAEFFLGGIMAATSGNRTTEEWTHDFLDSPNTTSQVTYQLFMSVKDGGSMWVGRWGQDGNWLQSTSITVMEIAG